MTFEFIKKSLSELLAIDEKMIRPDSILGEDLGMDELDIIDMVMDIEDEYNIEIDDETLEKFVTVGDVVKYIEENM